jgi:hypothetical protein
MFYKSISFFFKNSFHDHHFKYFSFILASILVG